MIKSYILLTRAAHSGHVQFQGGRHLYLDINIIMNLYLGNTFIVL